MNTLSLLLFLLTGALPNQTPANMVKESSVVVISAKWSTSRLTTSQVQSNSADVGPAPAVTQAGKVYERRRVNASVGTLAGKSPTSLQENVVINRVEYADGSIWQRRDWSFAEVKQSYARALATPWGAEMCRAL